MNGNILDTNVIIRIIKGDKLVADKVRSLNLIHTSVIVMGELLFGAEKSQLKKKIEIIMFSFVFLIHCLMLIKSLLMNTAS